MSQIKKILIGITILLSYNFSNAFDISLLGGINWAKISEDQYVGFPPHYSTFPLFFKRQSHRDASFMGGVRAGYTFIQTKDWEVNAGINVFYMDTHTMNSWSMDNSGGRHTYSYQINNYAMLPDLMVKYTGFSMPFQPYLVGLFGYGFNRATHFNETPSGSPAVYSSFENTTTGSWAMGLGMGVDYALLSHLTLGLVYNWFDFGYAKFSGGYSHAVKAPTTNLELSPFQASILAAKLTYQF